MSANLPYTQNQKWAKDSGGFGFRMLAKMGWTEGKGLGKKEDGAVSHVRVKKRADQLALGAEGVVDMTGNASLVGAVQDFNTLLSQLSAVGTGACVWGGEGGGRSRWQLSGPPSSLRRRRGGRPLERRPRDEADRLPQGSPEQGRRVLLGARPREHRRRRSLPRHGAPRRRHSSSSSGSAPRGREAPEVAE